MVSILDLQTLLKTHFGYSSFRPNQQEIITSICRRENALVIMPTGGGKAYNKLKREILYGNPAF